MFQSFDELVNEILERGVKRCANEKYQLHFDNINLFIGQICQPFQLFIHGQVTARV